MTTYPISVQIIPGLPKVQFRNGKPEGVIAHSTATPEASAQAEHNFEARTFTNAFVHFFVDWNQIIQNAPTNYGCYGCGAIGNRRFIQVELCETKDEKKFKESYDRYTWLLAKLLHDNKLGIDDFHTHHWVTQNLGGTTHVDPDGYLASHGVSVSQLTKDVKRKLDDYARVYTVVKGDSLWAISRKLGVTVEGLQSKNGLGKSTVIQPGQKLKY